jgi:hypothetical protein
MVATLKDMTGHTMKFDCYKNCLFLQECHFIFDILIKYIIKKKPPSFKSLSFGQWLTGNFNVTIT